MTVWGKTIVCIVLHLFCIFGPQNMPILVSRDLQMTLWGKNNICNFFACFGHTIMQILVIGDSQMILWLHLEPTIFSFSFWHFWPPKICKFWSHWTAISDFLAFGANNIFEVFCSFFLQVLATK